MAKASWRWYACNLNVEVAKLSDDAEKAAKDELKAEEKRIAAAWQLQEKLTAEHVKLRLKLSK